MLTDLLSWAFHDKSTWGNGPWHQEPDKVQWTDQQTKLTCLVVRSQRGNWCGYVGVPAGHPFYEVHYENCALRLACSERWCDHAPDTLLTVHGGLTYSGACREAITVGGICHVPPPGECGHLWWLGFVCPSSYVQTECRKLALQLFQFPRLYNWRHPGAI